MKNINRFSGDNTAGIEVFYFASVEDILLIPAAKAKVIEQDIQMNEGAVWYSFACTAGSLGYREPQSTDRNGTRYKMELKGLIAKDTPELSASLSELEGRKFVLIYKDHNGFYKLIGSKEYYLTFERDQDTGNDPLSSLNGFTFSFSGDNRFAANFYTGSFTVSEDGQVNLPNPTAQFVTIQDGNGEIIGRYAPGSTVVIESGFSFGFRILS